VPAVGWILGAIGVALLIHSYPGKNL
jgi:hypothetical protein